MKNLSTNQKEIIATIEALTGFSLTEHVSVERSKRSFIHLEAYKLSSEQVLAIYRLAQQYKSFKIQENGYRGFALTSGDKK